MDRAFDFIIVGSGSAGCVLANRLTEDPKTTVALVEAGGPDKKAEIHIPAAFSKLFKSAYDWAYFTEEQPNLNHRRLYWPRGKVLGGSSSMNAMIYTRGHRHDFDEWRDLGSDGWGWDDVVPAFTRAERRPNGRGGLLSVSDLRSPNPLSHAFVAACEENGIARNPDFTTHTDDGANLFQVTQLDGKRHSTAVAYLKPALSRPNLTVFTKALTTRVLFDGMRASGIECVREREVMRLRAEREVILSAGAINTPQILMLSGVGPAGDLQRAGVRPLIDLAGVGGNLQDHLVTGAVHACTQPVTLAGAETLGNLFRYLVLKRGMLTSNVAEAGAFVRMEADAPAPDIELIFGATYYMNHGFENPPGHGFTVGAILLHPKSRGTIRLRSHDPIDQARIDPNYFAEESDRKLLIEGTKLCVDVARAKAFDAYRGAELWPGDADLDDFVRARSETLYHPVGTCRMGSDEQAVVDSRLRVRGAERLRVVDASVMPTIVTGHPNAAVVMIAEKAAEMIRGA